MNDNAADTSDIPPAADPVAETPEPEVRKAPRRKRVPAPPMNGAAADAEPGSSAVDEAAAATETPKAPRRRRAPARSADAVAAAEPAEEGAASFAAELDAQPLETGIVPDTPPAAAALEAEAQAGVAAAESALEDAPGLSAEPGAQVDSPRPGRNRRRRGGRGQVAVEPTGEAADSAEMGVDVATLDSLAGAQGNDNSGDSETERDADAAVSPQVDMPLALDPQPASARAGDVFAEVLSGAFDVAVEEVAVEAPVAHKRVLLPEPEAPKLHKVLAQAGVGSRRDMEQMILDGLITVNGEPAHTGQRISFGDQIAVRGKPVRVRIVPPPPRIIAYHKPAGEVVTNDDPQHRPTVFRRLPRLQQGKWQAVGRLDLNTEGLLLFTNSGELANQLMHPRFGVEREYAVRVLGTLDSEDKAMLLEGVQIEGQTAAFRSIEDGGGEGANRWYRVVIAEGRNREVRKLFAAVDLTVSRLIRIRYGSVVLPRGLRRGVWVDLDDNDVRTIRRLAGGPGAEARSAPGQPPARGKNRRDGGRREGGPVAAERPPRDARPPRPQPQFEGRSPEAAPARARDDAMEDDFDPSRIPNPLEQTFDKRFVQNPRSPAGGRGFGRGGGGFGAGGSAPPPAVKGGPKEPDPLQTSVGYIGADAYHRKSRGPGGGGGGFGGPRGGGQRGGSGGGMGGGGNAGGGGRRGR